MLESSGYIAEYLSGTDLATNRRERQLRSAVERELQISTEAASRLGKHAEQLCPTIDWRAIKGLGNVLRHEYDDIDDEIIWKAIHNRLPELRAAVRAALAELPNRREEDLP